MNKSTRKDFVVEIRRNRLKGRKKELPVARELDHAAGGRGEGDKKPGPARTESRLTFPRHEKPCDDPAPEPEKSRQD
ncbi:MAG: hypothetical protein EPN45_10415 [Rhizobiaceae bacterium]|jgi:hypothetical protein|nr:MAG: hypothetical protein EPN45_10415 [Rhizobiaceae bacterium]